MIDETKLIEFIKGEKYILVDENSTNMTDEYEKKHAWELSRNKFINSVLKEIEKLKLPDVIIPDAYQVGYYDSEHNNSCFDEDFFYKQDELSKEIQHSKESFDKNYIDKTRVFAIVAGTSVELCEAKGILGNRNLKITR